MKAGTSKHPKYIPLHGICHCLANEEVSSLIAFHAITGCDTVSKLSGQTKKTAWHFFHQKTSKFTSAWKGPVELNKGIIKSAEKFVCQIYEVGEAERCEQAHIKLF